MLSVNSLQVTLLWLVSLGGADGYLTLYTLEGSETGPEQMVEGEETHRSTHNNPT